MPLRPPKRFAINVPKPGKIEVRREIPPEIKLRKPPKKPAM
jgi:hypothetical protein